MQTTQPLGKKLSRKNGKRESREKFRAAHSGIATGLRLLRLKEGTYVAGSGSSLKGHARPAYREPRTALSNEEVQKQGGQSREKEKGSSITQE